MKKSLFSGILIKAKSSPAQIIALSFFAVIFSGTILLMLPAASSDGNSAGLLLALFTATSATCVTGLVMVDTATYWSVWGQTVILILIQIGGLGLVTITTFFFTILKKKLGIRTMEIVRESASSFSFSDVKSLLKKIIIVTFSFEIIGAIIFAFKFIPEFGTTKGIYYSIFHSVSSFCNAGFDIMGTYSGEFSSLTAWYADTPLLLTTSLLIIFGGMGFIVWSDILNLNKSKGLNFHSLIVIYFTVFLITAGTIFFFFSERNNYNPDSLGQLSFFQQIQSSFFQSVTSRTAGFNTLSQNFLTDNSKIFNTILMFIGASPGSTAGGIKITTFAILVFFIVSEISGNGEMFLMFGRRISRDTASRAMVISSLSILIIIFSTMIITIFERSAIESGAYNSLDMLFESVSAFSTVGLSSAGTPDLSSKSHILIIVLMYVGRIGPISFALALAGRNVKMDNKIYPEGKLLVG